MFLIKMYILIHIWLCGRLSDKKFFTRPEDYFFSALTKARESGQYNEVFAITVTKKKGPECII